MNIECLELIINELSVEHNRLAGILNFMMDILLNKGIIKRDEFVEFLKNSPDFNIEDIYEVPEIENLTENLGKEIAEILLKEIKEKN